MKKKFKRLTKIIEQNQNFVLSSHIHTDGDALGSLLALYYHLKDLGKDAHIFVPGTIPQKYKYLGVNKLINKKRHPQALKLIEQTDVIFILDISALDRLDVYYGPIIKSQALKVCIDHHPINGDKVDLCLADETRIATAEIIYEYFLQNKIAVTFSMAEALYTAILSDSGSFRFFGTSAFTLQMAANLVNQGVDPVKIYSNIFENASHRQLRAWGRILTELKSDGFFEWAAVSQQFLKENRLNFEEINGIIDIMRKDGKAQVFAVFVEKSEQEVMVGLRSRNGVDVGGIARSFGGGGHFHAAGFTSFLSLQETIEDTQRTIEKAEIKK
jgi:phosphoesterase RecJ-like protein